MCLGLVVLPARRASAFALMGTPEAWQTANLGYQKTVYVLIPDGTTWSISSDDFAWHPHNLGEEYRGNTPVLFYTYDQSFLDYFGSKGVAAVDAAAAIINGLTNVSSFTPDLSEFPLEEGGYNYTAQALHLFDVKSAALELLFERFRLIAPDNWTWCIRARVLPTGYACPQFDFLVVQRNWDPVTWEPSRYVNGTLFTYAIEQQCTPTDLGDAVEFPADPSGGNRYSALATLKVSLPDAAFYGYFHTGLTRDDAGGLRYLYATNNMNTEASGPGTVTSVLDLTTTNLLVTSNLTLFAAQALTNDAAGLTALYPGLVDLGTTPIFTNLVTTNVTVVYTNYPTDPYGTPPHPVYITNRVTTVATWYRHSLANVFTNSYATRALVTVITTNVAYNPLAPYGTPPQTNVSVVSMVTNMTMGDFYIMPTNLCGVHIVRTQLTSIIPITNTFPASNSVPVTTNTFPIISGAFIYYFTNHVFQINPILCEANTVALRQGIEKVTFIRRDYDSLLGQYFAPITNFYTLTSVTNYSLVRQTIQRVVTQPDILFTAADLAGGFPSIPTVIRSAPTFEQDNTNNLAGPGVIRGPATFQFNKVGPGYVNGTYPFASEESLALLDFAWASFDATTNAPVIYPNGASIANLEDQVLIQISPPYLPAGTVGVNYGVTLQAKAATPNWQGPFSWALASGSAGLPPGLMLASSGGISGTPVMEGFYNFVVQVMDAAGRTAQQSYVINVAPHP